MFWSELKFLDEFTRCENRYEDENRWFKAEWWGDRTGYVLNAWWLYRCAYQSALGMLLLGTAKIRNDPALAGNFGFASAGGLKDPQELALLKKLEQRRAVVPGAPAVLGQGSILNDQNWTPLLNDAFILGGVHARHEFHLAEDSFDQYLRFVNARAVFDRSKAASTDAAELWRGYFTAHPENLWMNNAPRVLARELIGLKTFGYRPRFDTSQLSFVCEDPGRALNANLVRYLDAVREAGFHGEGAAPRVFNAVSEFLFGEEWGARKFENIPGLKESTRTAVGLRAR